MKVAIIHFRIGLTDGVSLQIEERVNTLKKLGHQVVYISGTHSPVGDLKLAEFEYKTDARITKIQRDFFSGNDKTFASIKNVSFAIEKQLEDFYLTERFDFIFIHNFFSLPVCIPATVALSNFLKKHTAVRANAVHHDFYWDPPRKNIFEIRNSKFEIFINSYFPPLLPNMTHTTISKWEQKKLRQEKNIDSYLMTDTFDFTRPAWKKNAGNKYFLEDIGVKKGTQVLLLAARIRERKGVELAIEFTSELDKYKHTVLILAGEHGPKEAAYVKKLRYLVRELEIETRWIHEWIGSDEEKKLQIKKYSLWDSYVFADAIMYPSLWEGLGNQFLEAVFAKKPIVVFEYPVFKTDLKPAGFQTVSLGDTVSVKNGGLAHIGKKKLAAAAGRLHLLLRDREKYSQTVNLNYIIGKTYYNTTTSLKIHIEEVLKRV